MIGINKGHEPYELITYRQNVEDASYSNMNGAKISQFINGGSDDKLYEVVLNSLAKEQGFICAYCMRRIPQKKVYPQMTIEHINPQHAINKDEALDYQNMVAVCNGNRNSSDNNSKTCDARRAVLPLRDQTLYLNPLIPSTLRNIYYLGNGEIHSSNKNEEECINNVLNLNCDAIQLPDARKSALNALQQKIRKDYPKKRATKRYFQGLLNHYNSQEYKTPYVGILIAWLEKRV